MYISKHPYVPIPPVSKVSRLYETVAGATGAFTSVRAVAIALNTAHLDPQAAQQVIAQIQTETKLPCTDPVRLGAEVLLDVVIDN